MEGNRLSETNLSRLEQIKTEGLTNLESLVKTGYVEEKTLNDVKWLIEQSEKYQKLSETWLDSKKDPSYETIQFLRVCKEVIEDFKIEKRRKPMA
jgi:hypothetical protein